MARLGASVQRLRSQLDLSQEELAERAGLHRTYIAGIEGSGRNVTLKSIDKLAAALRVSTAELLSLPQSAEASGVLSAPTAVNLVDILFVEDNLSDVELTLQAFRQARIANRVHVARDGAEALAYLFPTGEREHRTAEMPPQMILLDLNLPKVPGLEVLRRVKQNPRTRAVPVIVLTASQKSQDIEESRRLGAETYIVKPVDFQSLSLITPQLQLDWALLRSSGTPRPPP